MELFSLEEKVALLPGGLFVCAEEDHLRTNAHELPSPDCSDGGANIRQLRDDEFEEQRENEVEAMVRGCSSARDDLG